MGDFHVGVRSDDAALLESLRSLYNGRVVEDDLATDDYGFSLARQGGRGVRQLPYLVHGRRPVLRSRSVARLLRRLDLLLDDLDPRPNNGLVRIDGVMVITKGTQAAVVPESVGTRSTALELAAARAKCGIADAPSVWLDPMTHHLVVLPGLSGRGVESPMCDEFTTAPGRYEICGLFWADIDIDPAERRSVAMIRLLQRFTAIKDFEDQHLMNLAFVLSEHSSKVGLSSKRSNLDAVFAALG